MLAQVFGVSDRDPAALAAAVQRLIVDRREEDLHLEFKSEYPGKEKDAPRECCRDVVAMANGSGGVIAFGILEENERAKTVTPVSLGRDAERLMAILRTNVEPFLTCATPLNVPLAEDGTGVLLLEVRASPRRPHAVVEDHGYLSYWRRSGKSKHQLSEAEVERAYRDRWAAHRLQSERVDALREIVRSRTDVPCVWVAAVPVEVDGRVVPARDSSARTLRELAGQPHLLTPEGTKALIEDVRVSFRALDSHDASRSFAKQHWDRISDSGDFVSVRRARDVPGNPPAEGASACRAVDEFTLFRDISGGLVGYREIARAFEIAGECAILAGLRAPTDVRFLRHHLGFADCVGVLHSGADLASTRQATVDELFDGRSLLLIVRGFLEDILGGFGIGECRAIRETGEIALAELGSHRARVEEWARVCKLPVTGT